MYRKGRVQLLRRDTLFCETSPRSRRHDHDGTCVLAPNRILYRGPVPCCVSPCTEKFSQRFGPVQFTIKWLRAGRLIRNTVPISKSFHTNVCRPSEPTLVTRSRDKSLLAGSSQESAHFWNLHDMMC